MSTVPKQKRTWLRALLLGLACVTIISLYPFESVVCPAWTLQVVDETGNPLRRVFVRQVWEFYSVGWQSHRQDAHTDENGNVSFPERTVRVSLLSRALGAINLVLPHGSCGPVAYVLAYGDIINGKRLEGSAHYEEGKPLPARLVTRVYDLHLR